MHQRLPICPAPLPRSMPFNATTEAITGGSSITSDRCGPRDAASVQGGKMLEDLDPPTALKLVMEGLDMMETQQDSGPRNPDMYTDAVTMAVRAGQWDSAADALLRYGAVCAENNTRGSLTKVRGLIRGIIAHSFAHFCRQGRRRRRDLGSKDLGFRL